MLHKKHVFEKDSSKENVYIKPQMMLRISR